MAQIPKNVGWGGSNLAPEAAGDPSLKTILDDIADDLAAGKAAEITSPDATDLATVITLANEIKAALNAVQSTALKTTKEA